MLPTHRVTPIGAERHPHRAAAPALPRDATRPWEPGTHRVRSRVWDTAATDRPSYGAGKKTKNKQENKRQHKQKSQPTHSGRCCCTALLQAARGRAGKLVSGMLKYHLSALSGAGCWCKPTVRQVSVRTSNIPPGACQHHALPSDDAGGSDPC